MLVVMMAVVLLAVPMFSQTANGRISGTVKDQTGGAIVGAAVVVTDVARGLARNLTTDEAGAYLAPNLIPGTYAVRASYTGFQAWERANIRLEVGGDMFIDVVLVPGAQTQTVTITEEIPLVNTTSATLGGTLSNETINDLPISGRNFTLLLELRPGVVLTLGNNSGGTGAASANGLRPEQSNEYIVEGLHGMSPFNGQPIMNSIPVNGDAGSVLPVDAIQEFNMQQNTKAEYGWRAGGTVNIGLKSGTNALHGTGYAFFRRDALEARNYFNLVTQPAKVNLNLNQYGGTVGGPIIRDKLFFFLGFEQQRLDFGGAASVDVPFTDPAMLNCVTSPAYSCTPIANSVAGSRTPDTSNHFILACLGLPAANRSAQSRALVGLNADCSPGSTYPNATNGVTWFVPHGGTDHGATADIAFGITSYVPNAQTAARALGSVAKVDYQLNEKNTVNGFLFKGQGDSVFGSNKPNPIFRTGVRVWPLMVAGTWTWLPNAAWANSFRVGYATLKHLYIGLDTQTGLLAADFGLPTGVTTSADTRIGSGGYPQSLSLNGFSALGSRNTEVEGPNSSIEINDQVNYLRGQHSIRFGGTLMTNNQNGGTWANTKGTFSFGRGGSASLSASGLISFLAGQNPIPVSAGGVSFDVDPANNTGLESASLFYGNPESHIRRMAYSLFFQDDWRILPRFTLNLGLRYDLTTVPYDRDHIFGSFNPNLGLVQEGIHIPAIHNPDHNNFGPRVGFAWDVRGNGKTVIRAGGSLIYELVILRTFSEVGNSPGLAGNPTAWVIGCSTPVNTLDLDAGQAGTQTIAANAASNCPGTLFTSGGTRDVGLVNWSRSDNTIVGVVNWESASTIYPSSAIRNCNPLVRVRDAATGTAVTGRVGAPCPIVSMDPHLRTPYVETWTLSIQHAITNNVVLDVAYVGNHGTLLIGRTDDNQPAPGSGWTPALIAACTATPTSTPGSSACNGNGNTSNSLERAARPFNTKFPFLESITRVSNAHTSNYNGLQMTLTARNFHGLSTNFGYTYSKSLDVAGGNGSNVGTDSYNVSLDYGRSGSDRRHRFTLSPSYSFPAVQGYAGLLDGWKLNGVLKYQTGAPWQSTATNDFQGSGRTTRWDFSGDPGDFVVDYTKVNKADFHPAGANPSVTATTRNPQTNALYDAAGGAANIAAGQADLAINTPLCSANARSPHTLQVFGCWTQGNSVITPPPVNSFGNMGKGLFNGPTYWTVDMNVAKRQRITERLTAEFRAEFFNVLNHPVFSNPSTGLGCSTTTCNLGLTSSTPDVGATNAGVGSGGARRVQLGVKLIF